MKTKTILYSKTELHLQMGQLVLERHPDRTNSRQNENPVTTKAHHNEISRFIKSKNVFVLMGFRSDGPSPIVFSRLKMSSDFFLGPLARSFYSFLTPSADTQFQREPR